MVCSNVYLIIAICQNFSISSQYKTKKTVYQILLCWIRIIGLLAVYSICFLKGFCVAETEKLKIAFQTPLQWGFWIPGRVYKWDRSVFRAQELQMSVANNNCNNNLNNSWYLLSFSNVPDTLLGARSVFHVTLLSQVQLRSSVHRSKTQALAGLSELIVGCRAPIL